MIKALEIEKLIGKLISDVNLHIFCEGVELFILSFKLIKYYFFFRVLFPQVLWALL